MGMSECNEGGVFNPGGADVWLTDGRHDVERDSAAELHRRCDGGPGCYRNLQRSRRDAPAGSKGQFI
mgnify:FL=1